MGKVFAFIKKEVLEVIPPTLFFFVAFHIIAVTREGKELRLALTPHPERDGPVERLHGVLVLDDTAFEIDATVGEKPPAPAPPARDEGSPMTSLLLALVVSGGLYIFFSAISGGTPATEPG